MGIFIILLEFPMKKFGHFAILLIFAYLQMKNMYIWLSYLFLINLY